MLTFQQSYNNCAKPASVCQLLHVFWQISCTTSPASVIPNAPTTGAIVPLTLLTSGDQTHWNFFCGHIPSFFILVRSARASGQPSTFRNSLTLTCVASSLRAAPIDENNVAVDCVAF